MDEIVWLIPPSPELGGYIKNLRLRLHKSTEDVAGDFCSRNAIHLIEKGKSGMSELMTMHLANVLLIPFEVLLIYGPQNSSSSK